MRCILLFWLWIAAIRIGYAQEPTIPRRDADLSRYLQDIFPVQTEGIDYEAVFDALTQLYASPLDLNTATRDELEATFLLSERQLSSLMDYRTQLGPLLSIYELQAIPDFDLITIRRLLPFVTVAGERGLFGAMPTAQQHYLIARYEQLVETQKGFSTAVPDKNGKLPTRYAGSPQQYYLRYRYYRPRAFSLGFTMEKDPGEVLAWQPSARQFGADYLSFHAQLQNRGRWRNLLVGDYQLQIGQGLVLSAGFVLGKSAETVQTVRRPTLGARPYTSLTESGFFRGATATYSLHRHLDLTLLLSAVRRDANVDSNANGAIATSLQLSGLHRTPSERADRASLLETNVGAVLQFRTERRLQLGLTVLQTQYSLFFQKRNLPYNRFEFSGRHNRVVGLHGSYVWRNWNFFGEAGYSSGSATYSGGVGAVAGALASLTKRLDLAILARRYDRNFHSMYANAFSEGTRNSNEQGLYVGLKYSVYRRLTLSAFVDKFRFPGWKYLVDAPSSGFDYLLQARYTPNRQTTFYLIYHNEHKAKNRPGSQTTPREVVPTVRQSLALNADYAPIRRLTFRTRIQWGSFGYKGIETSTGWTLVQDATYNWRRLSLSGRIALFNTDDYDSRQYVYERDVLYAFSFPAYFNQGLRHYVLLQYNANRQLDIWVRWARTDVFNQPTVGSDLDQINGPHRSEIKLQARWRF